MDKVFLGILTNVVCVGLVSADIYRWDTGELIPGTEEIQPGPGVQLNGLDLRYADLGSRELSGANFTSSRLDYARFSKSVLLDAIFDDAVITGADFWRTTNAGFTED